MEKVYSIPGKSLRIAITILLILTAYTAILPSLYADYNGGTTQVENSGPSTFSNPLDLFNEYFSLVEIYPLDNNEDGKNDTVIIRYGVSTEGFTENVEVIIDIFNSSGSRIGTFSESFIAYHSKYAIWTHNFTYPAHYSDYFNFSMRLYDKTHGTKENDGNNYEISKIWLSPYKPSYGISVSATPIDKDNDGFNDDVLIVVTDIYSFNVPNVPIYIDGSLKGKTNRAGNLTSENYNRGYHEVDAFANKNHATTDFKSEGDGNFVQIMMDCDPYDHDGDGVLNDVYITVMREYGIPVRGAIVEIDNNRTSRTFFDGKVNFYNLTEGFHYVTASSENQVETGVFYSEPVPPIEDFNEFIDFANGIGGNFDDGFIANDIEVTFRLGVENTPKSNVTLNITLMYLNYTEIETKSLQYLVTRGNLELDSTYFYNLTKDKFRIYLRLFDAQWKLEDTWLIEEVRVTHVKMIVNVDSAIGNVDNTGSLNDIFMYANIMGDVFSDGYFVLKYANGTLHTNKTLNEYGYTKVANLLPGGYRWTVYENPTNNVLQSGEFTIYNLLINDIHNRDYLTDDDYDNYWDDFRVRAYDSTGNPDQTVYVTIWDSNNQVFAEGYTSPSTPGGGGSFLVRNIPEGNYTYQTRTSSFPVFYLTNGTFYSYGNESEASSTLNVFAEPKDYDSDGAKNDVLVKVVDINNDPVPNVQIYYDSDMTYYDTTDSNGEAVEYDFDYGWHSVDAISTINEPRGHAYTQFFSEGYDYNEYFWYIYASQSDADNDDEFNDLTVQFDVDVNEWAEVDVTVVTYLYYQDNGTFYKKASITYSIFNGDTEKQEIYFYDLPYNVTFNATFRLYDQYNNLEDEDNQDDIYIRQVRPEINIDMIYIANYYTPTDASPEGYPLLGFWAHQENFPTKNVTINIYKYSDNSLVYTTVTDEDGYIIIADENFEFTRYYWTAYDENKDIIEDEGWFRGHQNLSWERYLYDWDDDRYFDDFGYFCAWSSLYIEDGYVYRDFDRVNTSVEILDANKKLIIRDYTTDGSMVLLLNLTEGNYYCQMKYQNVIMDYDEFFSYGNGYANQEPTASIDAPVDKSEYVDNELIVFDGSSSSDPDYYDRLTFTWESDIDGILGDQKSFSAYLSEGEHNITLSVDDAHGHIETTWIALTVTSFAQPNAAPRAVISSPKESDSFYKSDEIYFDGGNSTDEAAANLTFTWSSDKDGSIGGNNSKFSTTLSEGTHRISLLVTDSAGLNSTDIVNITVSNRAPVANISSPMHSAVYNASDDIFFSSAGSYDPDDDTISFEWESNRTGIFGTTASFTAKLPGGVHNINLTVTDGSLNSTVNITLKIVNTPPEANISTPVEGWTYFKGAQFFDGSASVDLDGDVLYYYWELDDLPFAGNVSSFSKNVSELGPHTVVLYVYDGLVNVSDTVNFTIENQAPQANAGVDQKVNIGTELVFNASLSSDGDGDTLTYIWDFDDSDGINQIDAEGVEVRHTYTNIPSSVRSFNVTLTVNDGSDQNNTGRDNLTVNINRFPVANAGADVSGSTGKIMYFNGSNSSDPDDDKLIYQWDFGDGNSDVGLAVSHIYTSAANYTVSLNVSDGYAWDIDEITATIISPNTAPVAKAGPDITANLNTFITFNGSASSDIDGDTLSFSWDFDAANGITEDALGMEVTYRYTSFGTYIVTLTVSDGHGGVGTDNLSVTVNAPPTAVIAEVDDGYIGQKITFDASDSSDPENHVLTFRWDFGDESPNVTGKSVNHIFTDPDTYTVSLTVEDIYGAKDTASVEIEILPLPIPTITRPKNGDTVSGVIDIEGTATGETIQKVELYLKKQGTSSGSLIDTVAVTDGKWSTSWDTQTVENGNYDLEAKATDKDGKYLSAPSSSVRIKIDNEESIDDEPDNEPDENVSADWFDPLGLGTMMCVSLCIVLIVVLVIALVAIVRRGRGTRGKRPPAEALAAAQREMYGRLEAEEAGDEELGFTEIIDEEDESAVEDEGIKRPVKCPSCGEIFVSKDKGERPWMLFCTQCGAKGIIKEDRPKLPPAKEEEAPPPEKKERKKEKVRCPECAEVFSIWEDDSELECPNCGITGTK